METATKAPANRTALNARFHQLIGLFKLDADEKKQLVMQLSNCSKVSAKDLTDAQLKEGIALLENRKSDSTKRMRAKAINLARSLELVTGQPPNVNWSGLNNFTQKSFKKPFYELNTKQLRDCITALEKWQNHNQNKSIKELLTC